MEIDVRADRKLRESAAAQAAFRPLVEALCGSDADLTRARTTQVAAAVRAMEPIGDFDGRADTINRYVFYLTPGLATQARALVAFAAPRVAKNRPLAIV